MLDGKTAVITGGTTGIGLATAARFVDEGARVFITGRRQAQLDEALGQLGERANGVRGDVRIAASVFMLHGAITIPWSRKEPDEIAAVCSSHE